MATLTPTQIAQVARQGGFPESAIQKAVAIALAESSGNTNAHNTNSLTGDNSYGLWQINMLNKLGPERRAKYNLSSNDQLFDPVTNAKVANAMSNGGKNWSAWSTNNTGAYLIYMGQGKTAAGATQAWDPLDPLNIIPGDPSDKLLEGGKEAFGDLGGSGLWSLGTLFTGFAEAITDPDNWRSWAYVGIGSALLIAGLVVVVKPYAQNAATEATTVIPQGKLAKAVA